MSQYYKYYKDIKGHPHILSEWLGKQCDEVSDHTRCCALQQEYFAYLCHLINIQNFDTISVNDYLFCFQRRLKGNKMIRSGKVPKPIGITMDCLLNIKMAIIATFTPKVAEKPELLSSMIKIFMNKDVSTDEFVKEFFSVYNNPNSECYGDPFLCDTELGIAFVQIFSVRKADDGNSIFYIANTEEIKKHLEQKIKRKCKNSSVCKYQECSI